MGYTESELGDVKKEDFTTYFMCSHGARPNVIDIITIVPHKLDFEEVENNSSLHRLQDEIELRVVSYEFLKETKLFSRRPKDLWDISQLEKLRNRQ